MTSPNASTKVLIVPDARSIAAPAGTTPVRRFRIARLRFEGIAGPGEKRYAHLRRTYD